jgi:hypothetical protein
MRRLFAAVLAAAIFAPVASARPPVPEVLKTDVIRLNPGATFVEGTVRPPKNLVPVDVARATQATPVEPLAVSTEVVAKELRVDPASIRSIWPLTVGGKGSRANLTNGTRAALQVAAPLLVSHITVMGPASSATVSLENIPAGASGKVICTVSNPYAAVSRVNFGPRTGLEAIFGTIWLDVPARSATKKLVLSYANNGENQESFELWTEQVVVLRGCVVTQDK